MNYFELYYAYLTWCERDNWLNMRDPNHDYMEWNHTLPQCIFGDQPVGQWLTKKQHAIASALQTLAFGKNCMCGWHFQCIPDPLLELAKPFYSRMAKSTGPKNLTNEDRKRGAETQRRLGINFFDPDFHNFETQSAAGKVGGKTTYERGVGIFGMSEEERLETCSAGGKIGGYSGLNSDPEYLSARGKKGGKKASTTRAKCTVTGFESNISGLTRYQNARGIDTSNRIVLN